MLAGSKGWCLSLHPTKNHQDFQIRASTSNHYFLSSHHRLILYHCPRPTRSPSFAIVSKRRLCPHLAGFLHLFCEGKRHALDLLNPYKPALTVWVSTCFPLVCSIMYLTYQSAVQDRLLFLTNVILTLKQICSNK